MDVIKNKIQESFEELGVVYDKTVLDKCAYLSVLSFFYHLFIILVFSNCLRVLGVELYIDNGFENADELVDSWMAFSVTHLQGDNPKPVHLAKFEREFLSKKSKLPSQPDVALKYELYPFITKYGAFFLSAVCSR